MSQQFTVGRRVMGSYAVMDESLEFTGLIKSVEADTAGGGFSLVYIDLSHEIRFSWERDPRTSLVATVVNGELQDDRYRIYNDYEVARNLISEWLADPHNEMRTARYARYVSEYSREVLGWIEHSANCTNQIHLLLEASKDMINERHILAMDGHASEWPVPSNGYEEAREEGWRSLRGGSNA